MAYYISNIARSKATRRSSTPAPARWGPLTAWPKRWVGSASVGVAELVAPERFTRALGMEGKEALVRAYGVRELGHGIVSLSPDKHLGLWSRVAGDGLDIATLMTAMRHDNPKRDNVGIALAAVLGVTLLDIIGAQGVTARHSRPRGRPRSYRNRTGFPQGVQAARGAAKDFQVPPDMRAAPALTAVSDRAPQERARPR